MNYWFLLHRIRELLCTSVFLKECSGFNQFTVNECSGFTNIIKTPHFYPQLTVRFRSLIILIELIVKKYQGSSSVQGKIIYRHVCVRILALLLTGYWLWIGFFIILAFIFKSCEIKIMIPIKRSIVTKKLQCIIHVKQIVVIISD